MEVASLKDSSSLASTPFSSPNISALLKIKVLSWSQETGLPVSITIRVQNRIFNLHKSPLSSKSGYFNKRLENSTQIDLPEDFPGGPETFELIALFIYNSSTPVDPFNIAALRCAAEFLEMTEAYSTSNLCERFDLYLNQVVLQNWDDTLIVLQKCQTLSPLAEELLVVSRCIESLAFMACMEILDPERRREKPVIELEALKGQAWNCELVKNIVNQDLWIKDLIALPFRFFKRIVGSLRRQGMKEKFVSLIIVFYANKWIISKKTRQFRQNSKEKDSSVLQAILDLLPKGEKSSKAIPVGFYFALLSKALEFSLRNNSMLKLQEKIASLLQFSKAEDFLYPELGQGSVSCSKELVTMEALFVSYVSSKADSDLTCSVSNSIVAELWDVYLSRIVSDSSIDPRRCLELVETVPISFRQSHDQLYGALNTFLQVHKDLSQVEKESICKHLKCQKLSQEACIEAVQNELMPLRLIVQALFIQQLNTHQAFKQCSGSQRFTYYKDSSGTLSNLRNSPYTDGATEPRSRPLSFLLQKDSAMEEYESTSFRIQNLENELLSLKTSLQWQNAVGETEPDKHNSFGKRSLSKRRTTVGEITGCIGYMNFGSQRKYMNRVLKTLGRVSLFGSKKCKRKS